MAVVQEYYNPIVMAANSTVKLTQHQLGFFLAVTAGTISATDQAGTTIINALPVTAGVYYPLPIALGVQGGAASFTTAGGASGTLGAI